MNKEIDEVADILKEFESAYIEKTGDVQGAANKLGVVLKFIEDLREKAGELP